MKLPEQRVTIENFRFSMNRQANVRRSLSYTIASGIFQVNRTGLVEIVEYMMLYNWQLPSK